MAKKEKPAKKPKAPKEPGNISKIRQAYKQTKKVDPQVGLICVGIALGVAVVLGALMYVLLSWVFAVITGVFAFLITWLIVFGRRAEAAAYKQVEGQPGAAAAALNSLRRGWKVEPAVAVTKSQDVVHRVVGRPGVILVGEGNNNRVRQLLGVEKKKHSRVVGDVPIYDIVCSESGEEGVISVRRLRKHVMKLPKSILPADVTDVLQRTKALDAMRPSAPIPKGPMPTNARQARAQARGQQRGRR